MSDLLKLAERVEAATGPDRELDCAIAVALERTDEGGSGFHRVFPDDSVFEQVRSLPFTASLDAAMTLFDGLSDVVIVDALAEAFDDWKGRSLKDWPRFVTAAALKARASTGGGPNKDEAGR